MKHNGTEIHTIIHNNYPVKTWTHNGKIVFALCTVTFVDWDNTVLSTQTIPYGSSATKPSNPSRSGYTFTGWSGNYTNVTTDVTIKATYQQNYVPPSTTYWTVTFEDYDGTVIGIPQQVANGKSATPPSDPERYGYTFSGWSGSYTGVTSDRTITATYSKTVYSARRRAASATYDYSTTRFGFPMSDLPNKPTLVIGAVAQDIVSSGRPSYTSLSPEADPYGLPRQYEGTPYFGIAFSTGENKHAYENVYIDIEYYIV